MSKLTKVSYQLYQKKRDRKNKKKNKSKQKNKTYGGQQ